MSRQKAYRADDKLHDINLRLKSVIRALITFKSGLSSKLPTIGKVKRLTFLGYLQWIPGKAAQYSQFSSKKSKKME